MYIYQGIVSKCNSFHYKTELVVDSIFLSWFIKVCWIPPVCGNENFTDCSDLNRHAFKAVYPR